MKEKIQAHNPPGNDPEPIKETKKKAHPKIKNPKQEDVEDEANEEEEETRRAFDISEMTGSKCENPGAYDLTDEIRKIS